MLLKCLCKLILMLLLFAANAAPQSVVSDEKSIYSLVLKAVIEAQTTFFTDSSDIVPLLIIKETMPAISISSQSGEEPRGQKGLSSNFVRVNQEPIILTQQFSLDQRFRLVSAAEIDDLIAESEKIYDLERAKAEERHFERSGQRVGILRSCDGSWSLFHKQFPDTNGYFRLSRVGYSNNRRFALVEVAGLGACWNSNYSIYLKKSRRGWKIYTAGAGFGIA